MSVNQINLPTSHSADGRSPKEHGTFQKLVLNIVAAHERQRLVEADDADVAELRGVRVAVEGPPLQAAGEPPCAIGVGMRICVSVLLRSEKDLKRFVCTV